MGDLAKTDVKTVDIEILIEQVTSTDDYFEILGVDRDATTKHITKNYRALALRLHPDKCDIQRAEDAFKKVSEAFSCLRDEESREHYERFGKSAVGNGARPVDPNDLFREIFEAMQKAQAEGGAGGGNPFIFQQQGGNFGGNAFVINGGSLSDQLPAWAKPIVSIIPPQLLLLGFVVLLSYSLMFFLSRILYFGAAWFILKPPFRGFVLVVLVLAGLLGFI
mmetsp:Transcript_12965/g.20999  ORF Transcript_12965/g.20999 Transcript_12965/m.20999 type:complete len:221 (-) Transcript_12965:51-713(-)